MQNNKAVKTKVGNWSYSKWEKFHRNLIYENTVTGSFDTINYWLTQIRKKTDINWFYSCFGAPYGGWEAEIFYETENPYWKFVSCRTEALTLSDLLGRCILIIKSIYSLAYHEVFIRSGGSEGIRIEGIELPAPLTVKKTPKLTPEQLKIYERLSNLRIHIGGNKNIK